MLLEPNTPDGERPEIIEPLCAVFRRTLKGEGLKYTPERAQMLDTILSLEGLFDADRVIAALREKSRRVSKATVYRTLKLMLQAGIIQRVLLDEEQAHYQVVVGGKGQDLLIRLDTREAVAIEVPELTEIAARVCRRMGLSPKGHRLQIFAVGK